MDIARLAVKIGTDLTELTSGLTKVQQRVEKTSKKLGDLGKDISLKVTAPITAFGAAAVAAFTVQENAERKLAAALSATGQEVAANMDRFKSFASSLQELTTVGDETTLALIQVATAQGLNAEQSMRAAKNAVSMQAAFGVSAQSAIRMTAALEEGDAMMLKRYIPALRNVEDNAEAVAKAQEILGNSFTIAQEEALTFSGQLTQAKNALGDFFEVVGGAIAEVIAPFISRLKDISVAIQSINPTTLKASVIIAGLAASIGPAILAVQGLTKAFMLLTSPLALKIAALAAVAAAINYAYQNASQLAERFTYAFAVAKNAVISMTAEAIGMLGSLTSVFDIAGGAAMKSMAAGMKAGIGEVEKDFTEFGTFSESIVATFEGLTGRIGGFFDGIIPKSGDASKALEEVKTDVESVGQGSEPISQTGAAIERMKVAAQGFQQAQLGTTLQQVGTIDAPTATLAVNELVIAAHQVLPTFQDAAEGIAVGFAQAWQFGMKLQDVLKNLLKQLASQALMRFMMLALTGGTSSLFGGGIGGVLKGLFSVNDAMITSSGDVVRFNPNDNILAMKDFSPLASSIMNSAPASLPSNIRVTGQLVAKGSDLVALIDNSRRVYR